MKNPSMTIMVRCSAFLFPSFKFLVLTFILSLSLQLCLQKANYNIKRETCPEGNLRSFHLLCLFE